MQVTRTRLQELAKIMRERGDEAQSAARLGDIDITRRPPGAVIDVGERKSLRQARANHRERKVLIEPRLANVAKRHDFDKGELHASPMRPFQKRRELVLVHSLERNSVDLDLQAGRLGGVDSSQHLVELAPTRDGAELVGIEGIERDIDAPHAMACELAGIFRQLRAVGSERELVERPRGQVTRKRGKEGHDPASNQRLSAGEAQLFHSARNESTTEAVELLEAQQVGLGQEGHVFRHAINAAEIASVGYRDTQICNCAPERVYQAKPIRAKSVRADCVGSQCAPVRTSQHLIIARCIHRVCGALRRATRRVARKKAVRHGSVSGAQARPAGGQGRAIDMGILADIGQLVKRA